MYLSIMRTMHVHVYMCLYACMYKWIVSMNYRNRRRKLEGQKRNVEESSFKSVSESSEFSKWVHQHWRNSEEPRTGTLKLSTWDRKDQFSSPVPKHWSMVNHLSFDQKEMAVQILIGPTVGNNKEAMDQDNWQ